MAGTVVRTIVEKRISKRILEINFKNYNDKESRK